MKLPLNGKQLCAVPTTDVGANGALFTVTVTLAVPVHPFASVPITEYVFVKSGEAFTVAAVVLSRPVAGLKNISLF